MLKQEAKAKIEELNAQVCATSELTSASIIESQQEEIAKYPCSYSVYECGYLIVCYDAKNVTDSC